MVIRGKSSGIREAGRTYVINGIQEKEECPQGLRAPTS